MQKCIRCVDLMVRIQHLVCVCIKMNFHHMLKESKQKEAFSQNVLKVVLENYSQHFQSNCLDVVVFFFFTHTKFSEKLTCAYNISLVLGFVTNNSKPCLYSKNRLSLIEDEQLLSVSVTLKVTLSFTFSCSFIQVFQKSHKTLLF